MLLPCTAQRTAARFLLLVLYSCLLRCFSRTGAAAATALAYILTLLASQVLSLPHGPWCRLATTVAAGASVAQLWNMHLGACVFIIVMPLPSPWLWWAPKKSDDKLLEELLEVEQWARANLDVLRLREGDCFKAKLRQLNGSEEKRIYNFLAYHQKRLEASAALAAQLAKLDCIVMVPGDTGLHAAVPSGASGSRKARSLTDAGLSAWEEGRKRTKTEARGQTGFVIGPHWREDRKNRDDEKKMLLQLQRPHFEAIKSERKRWEGRPLVERRKDGRLAPWKYRHLATEGRVVILQSGPPPNLVMRVAEVRIFVPNVRSSIPPEQAMVMELGTDLLPDVADANARVQVYREIYGADICAHGFVAMRLKWADEATSAALL